MPDHDLPDPTAPLCGTPVNGTLHRATLMQAPSRERCGDKARHHDAQGDPILDLVWDDGRAAGWLRGYRAGWRWGVFDGVFIGAGLTAFALWLGRSSGLFE